MKTLLRIFASGLTGLTVAGATAWGALALWYALPTTDGVRATLALGCVFLGAGGLLVAFLRRRLMLPLLPFAIAFAVLLIWWSTIEPRNDRVWQRDVAVLPSARINGN